MKTNLSNAVALYNAINRLSDTLLDYQSAHAIVMAKEELLPHIQFFADKESALVNECAEKDGEGKPLVSNGQARLLANKAQKFFDERNKLGEVEVEITKRKLMTVPKELTPAMLEALMTAFDFPNEEDDNG